jgi:hypothetical protein
LLGILLEVSLVLRNINYNILDVDYQLLAE